jgi:putative spermidine/putrescine transport system substrate-binding protein
MNLRRRTLIDEMCTPFLKRDAQLSRLPFNTKRSVRMISRHLSRRTLLRASVAAAATTTLFARIGRAQTASGITFLTYGGIYGDNQKAAMVDSFVAASGIAVDMVSGRDAVPTLIGDTTQSVPAHDVIAFSDLEIRSAIGQGGLLAELDPAVVTNIADLPAEALLTPYAVNVEFDPWGLMYRTDKMEAPTSWKDLFEPKIDPARVGFQRPEPGSATFYNMIAAAVAAGGGMADVESKGIPAIKALRDKGAQFVDFGASLAQIQNDGMDLAPMYNNEAYFMKDQGLPVDFVFPSEGVFPIGVWLAIPANLPPDRKAAAQSFINHMIAPDPQVAMAKLMYSGPTNKKAVVDDELRKKVLIGADIAKAYPIDWEMFVANQSAWLDLWNREIAG